MSFIQTLLRWFRPSPRDRFLALARSTVAATPGVEVVSEDAEDFTLVLRVGDTGQELHFYLGNLFAESAGRSPGETGAKIERALQGAIQSVQQGELPKEAALENLVPVIRAFSHFQTNPLAGQLATRSFLPFLQEGLVLDEPDIMQYVTMDHLRTWALSPDEAFRIARARMLATEARLAPYAEAGTATPIWKVTNDDDYESSRLLIPGWLDGFRDRVTGTPVVVIPERQIVLVGGLDAEGHLARLLAIANERFLSSPRRLSPVPYTVDEAGGLHVLKLPADHPLAKRVTAAERTLASIEYANQRTFLDEKHAKEGLDIFVANYSVARQPDGEEFSLTYWVPGIESLIPRAEKVAVNLPDPSEEKGFRTRILPWDRLIAVAGACLAEDPTYQPVLYRPLRAPHADEIAAIDALFQ